MQCNPPIPSRFRLFCFYSFFLFSVLNECNIENPNVDIVKKSIELAMKMECDSPSKMHDLYNECFKSLPLSHFFTPFLPVSLSISF